MAAQQPLILLTRPAPQSRRFALALGRDCLISSLIEPVFLAPAIPPHAGLILTSETGADAAARLGLSAPAFCVGDRTAKAARAHGLTATSAAGEAEALIALVLAAPVAPLLHLRGREARGDIAARLTAAGVPTAEAIGYAQEERALTPEARAALNGTRPVVLPLFSPRTARILADQARGATAPLTVVAMSQAVAQAQDLDPSPVVARHPDGDSMLEAVVAALERRPLA